jgi:hypothetical protein
MRQASKQSVRGQSVCPSQWYISQKEQVYSELA